MCSLLYLLLVLIGKKQTWEILLPRLVSFCVVTFVFQLTWHASESHVNTNKRLNRGFKSILHPTPQLLFSYLLLQTKGCTAFQLSVGCATSKKNVLIDSLFCCQTETENSFWLITLWGNLDEKGQNSSKLPQNVQTCDFYMSFQKIYKYFHYTSFTCYTKLASELLWAVQRLNWQENHLY